ncbi:hypothetical protein PIB30_017214 [Stylosanthes scabra]|uniref:RRM domain-containing protein n=1 Tax=Stylosanthes scabra TaxID=79078 RepID=A0ABU6Y5U3_9FABA|nr:hypothetical protein [Stylosanthes scabra]
MSNMREGVSGWKRVSERGIHCEDTGYAGGRNKGESDGWVAPGVLEGQYGVSSKLMNRKLADGCFTVFLDNLPIQVLKGELFKEFWKCGVVTDVYISKKKRRWRHGPFAFIRFSELGCARRADVAGRKGNAVDEPGNKGRKELTLQSSTLQRDILERSLLGVSVNSIDFASLKGLVIERWDRQGKVECRDVGPFRCLITFESESIRDEAMSNQVLTDAFDEIRHH